MSSRSLYKKRPDFNVTAVQLDLDFEGFSFNKWGGEQRCSSGDWLVNNGGNVYTVEKEYFLDNYREISPGQYEKIAPVWAEIAEEAGAVETIEGKTPYSVGDYIVYDRPEGGDAYAVKKHKFEQMYEAIKDEEELSLEQEAYVKSRLEYHINWYDAKANLHRVQYLSWQTLTIVTAALVPILSAFSSNLVVLIAIMGGISAICAGILSLFKFQENWVKFRAACEDLRSNLAKYKVGISGYSDRGNAFPLLAENCERIISAERGQWVQQNSPKSKKDEK